LREAAARGAKSASLEVRVSNDAAIRLYRKYGFQVAGRRVRYYRDNDEDAYIMTVHRIQGLGEEEVPGERR
jgi:ribosomal-protein-alanine N-acetyltransferase